jgi:hypothetical protein
MISKIYSKVKTFFIGDDEYIDSSECDFDKLEPQITVVFDVENEDNGWVLFDPKNPPEHKVVLAACDSYDCGWCMSTVWWNVEDQCWMSGGGLVDEPHLPYTHWRELPEPPNENKWENK